MHESLLRGVRYSYTCAPISCAKLSYHPRKHCLVQILSIVSRVLHTHRNMPGTIMEIKLAQQARDIQRMARRRIKREYKEPEPCLRMVLGHYAVYHYATSVVQYEDVFELSDEEQLQVDESINEESFMEYSHPEYENAVHGDEENEEEEQRLWESACLKEGKHCVSPEYSEIDALRWLLPTDDQTLEYEEIEEPEIDMPIYEPPISDIKYEPPTSDDVHHSIPETKVVDPLRQHPPISSKLSREIMQEWRSKIFTIPQGEMQRHIVVFQLAEVLLRALRKLGIRKSRRLDDKDEGPDIEAQIDLQNLAAAIVSETKGRGLFAQRTTALVS